VNFRIYNSKPIRGRLVLQFEANSGWLADAAVMSLPGLQFEANWDPIAVDIQLSNNTRRILPRLSNIRPNSCFGGGPLQGVEGIGPKAENRCDRERPDF